MENKTFLVYFRGKEKPRLREVYLPFSVSVCTLYFEVALYLFAFLYTLKS